MAFFESNVGILAGQHGDRTLGLLGDVGEFVREQKLAARTLGIVFPRVEDDIGAAGECFGVDCFRSLSRGRTSVNPHVGEITTQTLFEGLAQIAVELLPKMTAIFQHRLRSRILPLLDLARGQQAHRDCR